MTKWHTNRKTIPPQETQLELPLQHNNANTDAATEEMVITQIGQTLTQISYFCALANLLHTVAQSSLATPKTEGALSFALWATATHLTSMCARLKTSIFTLPDSLKIIPSRAEAITVVNDMMNVIYDVCWETYGELPDVE
jgi:hypothetical protein